MNVLGFLAVLTNASMITFVGHQDTKRLGLDTGGFLDRCGHPTTRTILQQDGPNHLGLWYNALPEHKLALITSGSCSGH